jgi:anhydro-N-acetylmuramic acid kinase
MDGIDGVLAQIAPNSTPRILSNASLPMPQALREEFFSLNVPGGLNELERVALAGQQLAACYAQTCTQLLEKAALSTSDVTAIGAHGQTIRHRPDLGYTSQVNAPAVLAETTGINVIADFRSRDVAAGGQGAPLVPAFHATVFRTDYPRAILNLGGMANVTLLASVPSPAIAGFDTGPGNALLDLWCQRHTGQSYDAAGKFAAQGQVNPRLLDYLLASEPWLSAPPPKSTGRDLFNADWLDRRLDAWQARDQASRAAAQSLSPSDIQATLQFFTARTIAMAIERAAPDTQEILVCGGGAHNDGLMRALAQCLNRPVLPTDKVGIPGQWVEALAFAWLAYAHLHGIAAGLPDVTGARAPHVLGAFYPA